MISHAQARAWRDQFPYDYAWIIDWDHLELTEEVCSVETCWKCGPIHKASANKTTGPSQAPDHFIELLEQGINRTQDKRVQHFRIYDGDDELYYSGRWIAAEDAHYGEDMFGPLEDFGAPNAGATKIEYQNDAGEWIQL